MSSHTHPQNTCDRSPDWRGGAESATAVLLLTVTVTLVATARIDGHLLTFLVATGAITALTGVIRGWWTILTGRHIRVGLLALTVGLLPLLTGPVLLASLH